MTSTSLIAATPGMRTQKLAGRGSQCNNYDDRGDYCWLPGAAYISPCPFQSGSRRLPHLCCCQHSQRVPLCSTNPAHLCVCVVSSCFTGQQAVGLASLQSKILRCKPDR